jgi:hypothetical protein
MIGYPLDRVYEEVAFLAYYFHWDSRALLEMDHGERQRWCQEASRINRKLSGQEDRPSFFQE